MCDCGLDRELRMPMAAVVAGCGESGVGTPTQYVARWTEVAVVARERGYLAADLAVSFDDAAAVDAARAGIEEAVRAAISSEEDCTEDEARERTAGLVSKLDRPRRPPVDGGKGKRRPVACPTPLREVLEGSIEHEERWNRCAELVAERGLSMKAAVLLFATTMFCFTKDLVCTMTRAQLMAMTGIRTPASFAAAVRELMGQSLLSPKDGAPRTSWYLGDGFWGGLLADEELDTPVATLARGRKTASPGRGKPSPAGLRAPADPRPARAGGKRATGKNAARPETGTENRTSGSGVAAGGPGASGGVENRTSESARAGRVRASDAGTARGGAAVETGTGHAARRDREAATSGTGIENRTSGLRSGRAKVTVEAFAAEELSRDPVGPLIADRLADYYGKRGEYRIARARLRGLADRVRRDIEGDAGLPGAGQEARTGSGISVAGAGPRSRCKWCRSSFDHPGAGGDRGDGVCRGCDGHGPRGGPVQVGAIADDVVRRLGQRAGR